MTVLYPILPHGKIFFVPRRVIKMLKEKARLLDEEKLKRTITRLAHEIIERNPDLSDVVLLGIRTRGVPFAKRLADIIESVEGVKVPVDEIDISLYRDDLTEISSFAKVESALKNSVAKKIVVLCDDVIFTGRTARAAIDAVIDSGRPKGVQLAVVIDRGHRELPIKPDYVGKNVPTALSELISVKFTETDGVDEVSIMDKSDNRL